MGGKICIIVTERGLEEAPPRDEVNSGQQRETLTWLCGITSPRW